MSLDIYTMYTRDKKRKTGNEGYYDSFIISFNSNSARKGLSIRPCDYGDYVLQKKGRCRRKR